jgi:uncharacterized membrane protein YhiD involved in acid resistance
VSELFGPLGGVSGDAVQQMLLRLVVAMLLGGVVALIYRKARSERPSSFSATLVLLAILIAMVTQVIGDNIARAFSLVGALSIVRFRTVVRDTQDTAYVIFAVGVGMAVGAGNYWLAIGGIAAVGVAAFAMKGQSAGPEPLPFRVDVRVGLGHDVDALVGPTLDRHVKARRLDEVSTARQGMATEVAFRLALRSEAAAHDLVTDLNRIDGVQSVTLQRLEPERE